MCGGTFIDKVLCNFNLQDSSSVQLTVILDGTYDIREEFINELPMIGKHTRGE